jgi:hypothetical protein
MVLNLSGVMEMSKFKKGDKVRIIGFMKSGDAFGAYYEKEELLESVQIVSLCFSEYVYVSDDRFTFFDSDLELFEEPEVDIIAELMTNKVCIDIPEGGNNLEFIGYAFAVTSIFGENKLASPIFISDKNGKLSKSASLVNGNLDCYLKVQPEKMIKVAFKVEDSKWSIADFTRAEFENNIRFVWESYKVLE